MLANYLSDLEQLLEEHRWEQARREAADLPQVAAALADPELQASFVAVKEWCERWLALSATDQTTASYPAAVSSVPDQTVPALALRRLRLHRLARTRPHGFHSAPLAVPDDDAADAVEFCIVLIEGTRRWYAQSACHDATVQANLARLAVLR
jgi:hypothetical protein